MHYIIDGNNFIKGSCRARRGMFEDEKRKLAARLNRYASGRSVRITLVFDSRNPSVHESGFIRVVHAEDADERIAAEVSACPSPASAAVVSDDRGVIMSARSKGARTMTVGEFDVFLDKKLTVRRAASKHHEKPAPTGEDVEEWLKEYALRKDRGRG